MPFVVGGSVVVVVEVDVEAVVVVVVAVVVVVLLLVVTEVLGNRSVVDVVASSDPFDKTMAVGTMSMISMRTVAVPIMAATQY